jgi:hypothetical protein
MLITGKLACVGIGALALAGSALMPSLGSTNGQGLLGSAGNAFGRTVSDQICIMYRETAAEISPRLHSLPDTTAAFVRSNATTARLQAEGMANAFPNASDFAARLPGTAADVLQGGVPGAVQGSTAEAIALSSKIPSVRALKSNMDHLANLHPVLNGGTAKF